MMRFCFATEVVYLRMKVQSTSVSLVFPYSFSPLLTTGNRHSTDEVLCSLRLIGQRLINPPSHFLVICCKVNYTSAY